MFEALNLNALFISLIFILGYVFITLEHVIHVNKATTALMMAILCWALQFLNPHWQGEENISFLAEHLSNISQIIFFLLGALTIVEIINVHKGFAVITDVIQSHDRRQLLWIIGLISFFLSAVLDNLTATVVMISLLGKLMEPGEERLMLGGGVVIAANAGGAWTPIGDVTTTMLWVGGQVSTLEVMKALFTPSFICLVCSFAILTFMLKRSVEGKDKPIKKDNQTEPLGKFLFYLGVLLLAFVPVFRILTGLPPFMGMLFGLSMMWLVTDVIHRQSADRQHLRVPSILSRIDFSGTLFFLGILLSVDALDTAGILQQLAIWLNSHIGHPIYIAAVIGVVSAVIDNVPLVAGTMGMYDLVQFPCDHSFWHLIAYCAGTGGSILLIGSAAGVVFMGMEKVNFLWYLKRISLPALVGYFVGIGVYLLLS
jgi:Na+/H+ antiporter NhaD/arsenite permease-like protein